MSRLFIADDGYNDLCVWTDDPTHPAYPQPVLSLRDVKDAALREFIVAGVEAGAVA